MRSIVSIFLIFFFIPSAIGQNKTSKKKKKKVTVLIYTKNGKGYVHDNIPAAVACIQKLGQQYGFKTEVSDNPASFTKENLNQYSLLVFTSTNNDVFDTDDQRLAFRQFMEAGGGFVGIHSVVGTERNWDWFKMMLGGTFVWHPKFQKYQLTVIDKEHPSASGLPAVWEKEDECYFQKEMYPGIKTILAHNISSLKEDDQEKIKLSAGPFSKLYPAAWYQTFDGGYVWITALGHDKKDYEDPTYVNHIFQGIKFVASQVKSKEYSKAYALNRDEVIK